MPKVTDILATMDYGPSPEANGEVVKWLKTRGGSAISSTAPSLNPARLSTSKTPQPVKCLAQVAQGSAADVAAAVKAARRPARLVTAFGT
jgi:aldehyde dehydrogenase (NAD+)